jgi:hypothetical protein
MVPYDKYIIVGKGTTEFRLEQRYYVIDRPVQSGAVLYYKDKFLKCRIYIGIWTNAGIENLLYDEL